MQSQAVSELSREYDDCRKKINELIDHIKLLSKDNQLQSLEEKIVPEEYLTLLANSLYTINSLAFSYSNLKNVDLPPEFGKVQQYYKMAKNPLAVEKPSQPSVVVNKEAAKRVITNSLK